MSRRSAMKARPAFRISHARADDAAGLVADRGRLRRRLPVRARRALHQRGVVPVDARPSCRRRRCDGDLAARGGAKPGADGGLGIDRRGAAGARDRCRSSLASPSSFPLLGHATWHLYREAIAAELNPQPLAAPRPAERARCGFPGQPVPLAAQGRRMKPVEISHGPDRRSIADRRFACIVGDAAVTVHDEAPVLPAMLERAFDGSLVFGRFLLTNIPSLMWFPTLNALIWRVDLGANDFTMTSRFSVRALRARRAAR